MKVVIPHMGHLDIACRGALRNVGIDVVSPPRASNVSLKLGAKYSPELACLPFKINLGNFIDSVNSSPEINYSLKDYEVNSNCFGLAFYEDRLQTGKRNFTPQMNQGSMFISNLFNSYSYEAIPYTKIFSLINANNI